jgi:hypothetical protein
MRADRSCPIFPNNQPRSHMLQHTLIQMGEYFAASSRMLPARKGRKERRSFVKKGTKKLLSLKDSIQLA